MINEVSLLATVNPFVMQDDVITYNCTSSSSAKGVSYTFADNYYADYDYLVFRIKGVVGNEATKFALKLGNELAIQKNFNSLRVDSATLVPAITSEWQDIYISTSSLNGCNNQPYLQIIGIGTATIYIDAIYMTNKLPA